VGFWGTCLSVCPYNSSGGADNLNKTHRSELGQIFGTVFYVAYVIGQLRSITCTWVSTHTNSFYGLVQWYLYGLSVVYE
jgi:hypothetical protein